MKAYEFKISEILCIEVNKNFNDIITMEKNKEAVNHSYNISLDMEGFNEYMSSNEILEEKFDTYTYLDRVRMGMENYSLSNHTLNLELDSTTEKDNLTKKDIEKAIAVLNESLQEQVDEVLGSDLELYIAEKEEEGHYDKLVDFSNEIRKNVIDRLKQERPNDYFVLLGHERVPSDLDQRQKTDRHSSGSFFLSIAKEGTKKRKQLEELLGKSEFVIDYSFKGTHNDRVSIIVNQPALDILKQVSTEETEKFYKIKTNPDFEVRKHDEFIEKNSNKKGGLMDVYFNEFKREITVVENNKKRIVGINEETNDKTLNFAIDVVDNALKEKMKMSNLDKLKKRRKI
jgi:hypothetical protein